MPSSKSAPPSADPRFAAIADYYDRLVETYGHDPRACDYGRPESQRTKFNVLAAIEPLSGKRLLDVGCGFADFADYLRESSVEAEYNGIDLSPEMIARARLRRPDLSLRVANLLELPTDDVFDVVTANGIFYLLGADGLPTMKSLVGRMWTLSRSAVAFNSLSDWATDQDPNELYADPLATLRFCRELTPFVTLRHDYHSRDFTVYMYRDPLYARVNAPSPAAVAGA